jgi:3-hydroxybutyryl-CoA dehydrogenase
MGAKERIGVVGAGLMGSEIGLVFALAGHPVVIADQSESVLKAARARLANVTQKGAQRGFYSETDARQALERIVETTDLLKFNECDFVTEAVFEDLAVKRQVLSALDEVCTAHCVIATNTSTLPISTLAGCVREPRRQQFIGTHYFSPASRMKLVEVIPAFQTSQDCLQLTMRLCESIGKTPIKVKDVAGFAVNRVLHVLLIEAVRLVEEGVATPKDIDTACRLGLGHPIGPFELMDVTTSRLCLQAQEIMHEAYGERFRPRPLLKQRVLAGLVGGKGNKGWREE